MFLRNKTGIVIVCFLAMLVSVSIFAKTIKVISFNDFHGSLEEDTSPKGKNIGMEKFVSAIKDIEKNVMARLL
jgi:2',3'-cyclic-nucleotide 2'-phosphodiesterase (5'-nucleotidase family)